MHREDVILHLLRNRMPGYPFDPTIDFVDDFPHTNLLDDIRASR